MCRHALTELYDIDYTKYKLLQTNKKRTCHTLLFVYFILKCAEQIGIYLESSDTPQQRCE